MADETTEEEKILSKVLIRIGVHPTMDLIMIEMIERSSDSNSQEVTTRLPMTSMQALSFSRDIAGAAVILRTRIQSGAIEEAGELPSSPPVPRSKMN